MTGTNQVDHSNRNGVAKDPVTPNEYAQVVKRFYASTAIGDEYAALSHFLNNPDPYSPKVPFLTAYRFVKTPTNNPPSALDWELGKAVNYDDPEVYSRDQEAAAAQATPGRLLFLRGCPSPQWLNVLGAAHQVDPEMSRRWMDTHVPDDDHPSNFFYPPLSTGFWNLLELPVVTICKVDNVPRLQTQQGLDLARKESAEAVGNYLASINRGRTWELGTSAIRDVYVLDRHHLAIEQRITVCMVPASIRKTQGWTVLVWSDVGANANMLTDLVSGPWETVSEELKPKTLHVLPTTGVYRPNSALAAYKASTKRAEMFQEKKLPTTAQLHIDYGRYLRPGIMAQDPFFALREVLDVAAASERHFLNLVEVNLDRYNADLTGGGTTTNSGSSQFQILPSFLYLQQVLLRNTRHIQRVREALHVIAPDFRWQPPSEANGTTSSSSSSGGGGGGGGGHESGRRQRAREAATESYNLLYEQAQTLSVRCRESIQNLQYAISIAESKKALEQAGRVTKLTYLASLFVPLSFTTSFFGMNLAVLDKVPARTWVAVTVPILVLTLIVMFFDLAKLWGRVQRPVQSTWRKYRVWLPTF